MDSPAPKPQSTKLQRWVDLVAVLLSHHGTLTFEDLAREVPGYAGERVDSIKRTFERDKVELRELGIPIETIGKDGDDDMAYRLKPRDFYLPYLSLVSERGLEKPARIDKYGYRAIGELTFEAEELAAVAEAAIRARQLGDPDLEASVTSAMRKLAFDLPVDSALADAPDTHIRLPHARADAEVLRTLNRALVARKRVGFDYRSMSSDHTDPRSVEPYGLCFIGAHWYLVAREIASDTVRNYRVSRITNTKANAAKAGTADYDIPEDFRLRDHARSRQAWELGDGETLSAIVQIRGATGATTAAASLGAAVDGDESRRSFDVRRPDVFARWCLSFAGGVVPVSPPAIVSEFEKQRTETLAHYRR